MPYHGPHYTTLHYTTHYTKGTFGKNGRGEATCWVSLQDTSEHSLCSDPQNAGKLSQLPKKSQGFILENTASQVLSAVVSTCGQCACVRGAHVCMCVRGCVRVLAGAGVLPRKAAGNAKHSQGGLSRDRTQGAKVRNPGTSPAGLKHTSPSGRERKTRRGKGGAQERVGRKSQVIDWTSPVRPAESGWGSPRRGGRVCLSVAVSAMGRLRLDKLVTPRPEVVLLQ